MSISESNLKDLLQRCIDPIEERLCDLKNERAAYDGYELRQKRFDRLIADDEALLAEVRAAINGSESR